jgi:hypothetical protein
MVMIVIVTFTMTVVMVMTTRMLMRYQQVSLFTRLLRTHLNDVNQNIKFNFTFFERSRLRLLVGVRARFVIATMRMLMEEQEAYNVN